MSALYSKGIIDGYEDNTIRPDRSLTRAEAVKIFNKLLGRKPLREYLLTANINPFPDLDSAKWYFEDVLEASVEHTYTLNDDGYENHWNVKETAAQPALQPTESPSETDEPEDDSTEE